MRPRLALANLAIAGVILTQFTLLGASSPAALAEAVGGKMEHCALAVGMIAGGILGLIANPVLGAAAIGAMTAGIVWLTFCE